MLTTNSRPPCLFSFFRSLQFYFHLNFQNNTFLWKIIRWLISERVLKSSISSQTWDCDVLGCKKPCGKSLTSRAWSSLSKRERETANLRARHWSRDFLTFVVRGVYLKTLILRSLMTLLGIRMSLVQWYHFCIYYLGHQANGLWIFLLL